MSSAQIAATACLFVVGVIVLVVDFDAANERWCKKYPEWCEPVEIAEDTRTKEII